MGGDRDRVQSRGAESIDGGARNRHGQPRQHGGYASYVAPLWTVRLAATQNHIADFGQFKLRDASQYFADRVGGQIVRPRPVKGPAVRFRKRGTLAVYDNCFSHALLPLAAPAPALATASVLLLKSLNRLPSLASFSSSGAGFQRSPCCLWNSTMRSYTFCKPTVSA